MAFIETDGSVKSLITIQRDIYQIICWIITSLCTILLISIGIYHLIQTIRFIPSVTDKSKRHKRNSIFLSFLLIVVALLFEAISVHMTYTETFPLSLFHCQLVKWLPTISYTSFKALVYVILVVRLGITFGQKQYSTTWLMLWLFLVGIWTVFTNFINVMTTNIFINEHGTCSAEWSIYFLASVATLDLCGALLYSYLFMKPMLALSATLNRLQEQNATKDLTLKGIAVKQCVLALTATFTTLICACFVLTFHMTQVFASIDAVISTLSIVLMFRWNDGLFQCIGCGSFVHCLVRNERRKSKEMEMVMDIEASPRSPEFSNNQKVNALSVPAVTELESRSMQTDSAYSAERGPSEHGPGIAMDKSDSARNDTEDMSKKKEEENADPEIVIVFDDTVRE